MRTERWCLMWPHDKVAWHGTLDPRKVTRWFWAYLNLENSPLLILLQMLDDPVRACCLSGFPQVVVLWALKSKQRAAARPRPFTS